MIITARAPKQLEDSCDPLEVLPLLQALLICLEIDSWNCDNSCLFRGGSPFDTIRDVGNP